MMLLIVEDDEILRRKLKEILADNFPHMTVCEAGNGEDMFRLLQNCCPDIIFMDIHLPGENGLELTRKLKNEYHSPHIIIFSNCDSPEYQEAAFENGADDFISKKTGSVNDILRITASLL